MNLDEFVRLYDFTGHTVAITGGAGILGGEMACALVGCGAKVAILDRDPALAERLRDRLEDGPGHAIVLRVDVLKRETLLETARAIREEFGAVEIDDGPWCAFKNPRSGREIVVKDVIADAFLQQILLRPAEYDVIATMNLNGDYISDALAACVGGIGIAPGGNINFDTGHGIFEATHGTAPKYAGQDKVNPGSLILSGAMMLDHIGWGEAAERIRKGLEKTVAQKTVTYDLARQMEGARKVKCSAFAGALAQNL